MTTAPPIPPVPPGNRTLRVLLLACVAVAVVVGLVVAVSLFPAHHKTATAPTTAPSADASPIPSLSTAAPSISSSVTATTATSGPATTAPADPQAALKAQIATAYAKFLLVGNQVFNSTTLDVNTFNTVATGAELTHLVELTIQSRGRGYVSTGVTRIVGTSVVVAPAGNYATVTACLDLSDISTLNAKTGQVVAHEAAGHRVEVVYMTLVPPAWKVSGGPPQPTTGSC